MYGRRGRAKHTGSGIWAAMLLAQFGTLPVEDEGRLHDSRIRENFVERLFCRHRWREFIRSGPRLRDLAAFHARHKLTLAAHSDAHYRRLERLVAGAGGRKLREVLEEYEQWFAAALRVRATPGKHAKVLQHIAGLLKDQLDPGDRAEVAGLIENYRTGLVPLVAPLTLLAHHLRRHPVPWVQEQVYLNPYPAEVMLRSQV